MSSQLSYILKLPTIPEDSPNREELLATHQAIIRQWRELVSQLEETVNANVGTTYTGTAPISVSGSVISTSMSTGKLIGRTTASSGVMEEITPGGSLDLSAGALNVKPKPKGIWVEAPTSTDSIVAFFLTEAWTLAKIESLLPSGSSTPSVTFSVKYGTDITGSLTEVVTGGITTTSTTTGTATTVFNNGTIPANNFVLLVITAVSGTVPALSVTLA